MELAAINRWPHGALVKMPGERQARGGIIWLRIPLEDRVLNLYW
jgi:hypothetical protein